MITSYGQPDWKVHRSMEVLIVDDEPVSRLAVSQTLGNAGYQIAVARNGRDALRKLRQSHVQLVVCDWGMPEMSGLDLCREVRELMSHRYVYILMLTGNDLPQEIVEGLESGADDYLTKPFNPTELVLRVNVGRRILSSESRGTTVFALAKLAESRDSETGAHLERVRMYCRTLALALREQVEWRESIDDHFVRLIYDTSPLHDIGKVAIPDSILLKPGRLTNEEYEVMKTHTTHGANTLAAAMREFPNAEYLRMAHEIALFHHERYDGAGYPLGLAGDAIPLCARITALADVYDALTSQRVYKPAFSHRKAAATIVAERGAHFDPDLVDTFAHVESDFAQVRRQYSDAACLDDSSFESNLRASEMKGLSFDDAPFSQSAKT